MRRGTRWIGAMLAIGLASGTCFGQTLPQPAANYPDADVAGSIYPSVDIDNPNLESGLQEILRRDRRNVPAAAQLALLQAWRGQQRGRWQRDFDRARNLAADGSDEARHVHWVRGWALFGIGDYPGALEQWQEAERLHGGRPDWVPSTYAVLLWSMGYRELGLDFFEIAARDQPEYWGSPAAAAATAQSWRPNERLAVESMATHLAHGR